MRFFEQFSVTELSGNQMSITIVVAVILFAMLLASVFPGIKDYLKQRKTNRRIQRLGSKYIKHVMLPDGIGGSVFLDYIVLAPQSIMLVILKKFRGTIFCAENIDQWTQLIGNKSYKFPNTLQQLDSDISSVSSLVKNVNVTGLVVFSSDCTFPKGKPDRVKSISELKKTEADKQLHSETLLNAWYGLKDLAEQHMPSQSFAMDYFKDKDVKRSPLMPLLLGCALIAWLVWRMNFAS